MARAVSDEEVEEKEEEFEEEGEADEETAVIADEGARTSSTLVASDLDRFTDVRR